MASFAVGNWARLHEGNSLQSVRELTQILLRLKSAVGIMHKGKSYMEIERILGIVEALAKQLSHSNDANAQEIAHLAVSMVGAAQRALNGIDDAEEIYAAKIPDLVHRIDSMAKTLATRAA